MAVLLVLVFIIFIAILIYKRIAKADSDGTHSSESPEPRQTVRCPHCGSPVRIRSDGTWECGWCGNFGGF